MSPALDFFLNCYELVCGTQRHKSTLRSSTWQDFIERRNTVQLLGTPLLKCQQQKKTQPKLFLNMSPQILKFSYWTFSTGRQIPIMEWKILFNVSPESEASSTLWFVQANLRNAVIDSISVCLSHSLLLIFSNYYPRLGLLGVSSLKCKKPPKSELSCLSTKADDLRKKLLWLFILLSPSRQQGSSWWSLLQFLQYIADHRFLLMITLCFSCNGLPRSKTKRIFAT